MFVCPPFVSVRSPDLTDIVIIYRIGQQPEQEQQQQQKFNQRSNPDIDTRSSFGAATSNLPFQVILP